MDKCQFVIKMDEMIEEPNNEVSTLADCQMPFSQMTFDQKSNKPYPIPQADEDIKIEPTTSSTLEQVHALVA
jgi:hypothetical protein